MDVVLWLVVRLLIWTLIAEDITAVCVSDHAERERRRERVVDDRVKFVIRQNLEGVRHQMAGDRM